MNDDEFGAKIKRWYDGSLLEPEVLKIYQTIIDDGMEDRLGDSIQCTCNILIESGACTSKKPRPPVKKVSE